MLENSPLNSQSLPSRNTIEKTVNFYNFDTLRQLCGSNDKNLRIIGDYLNVNIIHTGERNLKITGNVPLEVDLAHNFINQITQQIENGEKISSREIEYFISMIARNHQIVLNDLIDAKISIPNGKNTIPKTIQQAHYVLSIKNHDLTFGIGPAGTGKTFLAVAEGVSELLHGDVKKLILCRPAVEAGEKLGFLPGDMTDKVDPYLRPLYDALDELVGDDLKKKLIDSNAVEVAPLAFMRGRTLNDAYIILDEAQNTTNSQMKMFLTRFGYGSKCVVTGDPSQIDLLPRTTSGLVDAMEVLKESNRISFTTFTGEDVMRHPLVTEIVDSYTLRDQQRRDAEEANLKNKSFPQDQSFRDEFSDN